MPCGPTHLNAQLQPSQPELGLAYGSDEDDRVELDEKLALNSTSLLLIPTKKSP
ncbi:MAG: hypothetical protein GY822_24500 [Deltaproteobacteria bacterium]|nr:hypothetical protein [Deltaproteobacteria bacterium]